MAVMFVGPCVLGIHSDESLLHSSAGPMGADQSLHLQLFLETSSFPEKLNS